MGRKNKPQEISEPEEEAEQDISDIDEDEIEKGEDISAESASESQQEQNDPGKNSNSYGLRPKKSGNIFDSLKVNEKDLRGYDSADMDEDFREGRGSGMRKRRKKTDLLQDQFHYDRETRHQMNMADIYDDKVILDKLPKKRQDLERLLDKVKNKLVAYKRQFVEEQHELKNKVNQQLENSIPICADITNFDFDLLRKKQLEFGQRLFDVIMMDPPWKLSTSQPSRGVAIQYDSLIDDAIEKIPVEKLQTDGFIFVWAINAKYRFSCKLIEKWGYKVVDEITWVKKTVNGKIAKGHGYYLQHAKESCIVGVKGNVQNNPRFQTNVASDVIFSERRGQSQKPTEIYEYIEKLVPKGFYLEIFGRRNNLRNNWVTIGNEL